MNMQQLPTAEHSPVHMQEQLQQPIFFPHGNPTLQTHTAHIMPMPMPIPTTNWSMESMPWKITKTDYTGDVMEFTAHATQNSNSMRRALLHQKRKSDVNATETLPVKQFISEEKITAHFNGLHISSDFIQHSTDGIGDSPSTSKCFSNLTYEDYKITAKELEEKLRNANRLTMCEELKKFNDEQKKISYLPEALLHRMHKPCTALVLWQPSPIRNIFSKKNINKANVDEPEQNKAIDDYTITDIDLPSVQHDEIDDFLDNNNTCNLDFNNVKPDSMDEDL